MTYDDAPNGPAGPTPVSGNRLPAVAVEQRSLATPAPGLGLGLQNPDSSQGLDLTSLLHSLRRQLFPALLMGLVLATIVAGLMYIFVPINYEAVSLLRVRRMSESILEAKVPKRVDQAEFETYLETQKHLITSPLVIQAALRDETISNLPIIQREVHDVAFLADELKVRVEGNSELIQISMRGEDAAQVVSIVDAVREAYINEIVNVERAEETDKLDVLRRTQRKQLNDLRQERQKFYTLAEQIGASDVESAKIRERIAFGELTGLDKEMQQIRQELKAIEMDMLTARASMDSDSFNPSTNSVLDEMERDPRYQELLQTVELLEDDLKSAAQKGRRTGRMFQQLQSELARSRQKLETKRAEMTPRVIDRLRRMTFGEKDIHQQTFRVYQTQRAMLGQRLTDLEEEHQEKMDEVERMGGASVELVSRGDEIDRLVVSTNDLEEEISRVDLNLNRKPRISTVQVASVPEESDWLIKLIMLGSTWGLSFLLTVVSIAFWDYQGKRVNSTEDVAATKEVRVIGTLPLLQANNGILSFGKTDPKTIELILSSSIDSVRTALLHNRASGPVQAVLVASGHGQEGRTTVASQLSVSLARSGRRTLLLDGDMRNPQQHIVFGLSGDCGLCEVLRREASLEEVIQPTSAESLWLMPAGACDQMSLQALSGEVLAELFEELRSRFDFIVIDSGPVLNDAEPLLLGQHVDTTLISVRRDLSKMPKIRSTCERLRAVGIPILGAVVNGVTSELRRNETQITARPAAAADETQQPAITS